MTPKVSICIPAYLQTQYLKNTLDSILIQDFNDYEVIITDDSPDESVEKLVKEYDFGSRLTYIHNVQQLGSPANWNKAVKISNGEYIKILHHDDWFTSPSSLTEYIKLLDSNPESGFAFSGAMVQIANTGKTWYHFATDKQIEHLHREPTCLFYGNYIGAPSSTIIRRESFLEYDENLMWLVDIAQYINILRNTGFVATQKPLNVNISNWSHQITNFCVGNKQRNIYEYFYLFDDIISLVPNELRKIYINNLIHLIYKYNIRSLEEIRQLGYEGALPLEIAASVNRSSLARVWGRLKWGLPKRLFSFMQSSAR